MTDPIKAAFISGGFSFFSAMVTLGVAFLAFNAWRRTTLGNKKIDLAEKCLIKIWNLDKKIKHTRSLVPVSREIKDSVSNRATEFRRQRATQALESLEECAKLLEQFKEDFLLAEFYIGEIPRFKFKGETRFFESGYRIPDEYDEIISQLRICLLDSNPDVFTSWPNRVSEEEARRKEILFFGFAYEYEQDEYSARLERVKRFSERTMRDILRRRTFIEKTAEGFVDKVKDNFEDKFKPVIIDKTAEYGAPSKKEGNPEGKDNTNSS